MATKLNNKQLMMLLANMPKMRQSINSVDNTGRVLPRPEENPASKEAMAMFMGQLQRKADSQKRYINDAGPAPAYKNIGEKVRADLEREQRQRDMYASIPNEKFNTWVENVGMPVADAAMIADAGLSLPKILEMLGGKAGSNAIESIANTPTKYGLFDLDRTKTLKEIQETIKDGKDLYKATKGKADPTLLLNLKNKIKEYEEMLQTFTPVNEITDPSTKSLLSDMTLRLNTPEGRKRVTEFMSGEKMRELTNPSKYGRTGRQRLPGLVQNSDLTNVNLYTDPFYKGEGAYYVNGGLNSIGISPKLYSKLMNMGEEGQNILKKMLGHELQHHYDLTLSPNVISPITADLAKNLDLYSPNTLRTLRYGEDPNKAMFDINNRLYWEQHHEKAPMLSELRQDLLNEDYIKKPYDEITSDMVGDYMHNIGRNPKITGNEFMDAITNNRLSSFVKPNSNNYNVLARNLNKLLGLSGVTVGSNAFIDALNKNKK